MSITNRSDLELRQAAQIKILQAQLHAAQNALCRISDLDYHEDSDESNEWAEADCFHQAQTIAYNALNS